MHEIIALVLLFSGIPCALAAKTPLKHKTAQKSAAAAAADNSDGNSDAKTNRTVLSDAWYAMQAGSTPWGYYHEVIEKREGRYYYRYEMTKRENGQTFLESIGAVAEEDLTPVAFNLSKAGASGTEIINGTYARTQSGGQMNVDISGARVHRFKKNMGKNVILEVFFPVWLLQNSAKLIPGYHGSVALFTENVAEGEYSVKQAAFAVRGKNKDKDCAEFDIELDGQKSLWCMNGKGAVVFMDVNNHQAMVRKVNSEAEAKAVFSGLTSSNEKKRGK